ncbi:hypothetical protein QLQ12_26500 [Actinoplanes sp. NEAU-A12]|uniref:Uncharacterized protein n=1 Tax=Actinoplanes sandaracinus TaxID=3045177 RepID=A0ABT6WR11_9ACTN|nr:hypothetical protein [Actinoplanes sandaracinus]MDI6102174.1 hypothetical protein [Actinoplanes sandaracinus]
MSDAAPGRRWPVPRQALALVRAALRVRSGSAAPRPMAVLVWQGVQLAAIAVLALGALKAVSILVEAITSGGGDLLWPVLHEHGPALALAVATLVTLVLSRQRLAAGLVLATIAVQAAVPDYPSGGGTPQWWAAVVAAPLVLAGLRRPADVPSVGPCTAVAVTVSVLALHLVRIDQLTMGDDPMPAWMVIVKIVVPAAFLWVATADRRMLLAVAPTFVLLGLEQMTLEVQRTGLLRVEAVASPIVGVALAAGIAAAAPWRHARL